jgi:hypothetical protein
MEEGKSMLEWTPAEITLFIKEVLSPTIPVLGTILIALIGRGIRQSTDKTNQEDEKEHAEAQIGAFSEGLLHHIALQGTRIGELEQLLKDAVSQNKELASENTLLKLSLTETMRRIQEIEKRVPA